MIELRFDPAARLELLRAEDWIIERAGTATFRKFVDAVDRALDQIESRPESPPHYPGSIYRWVSISGFPYIIVYRLIDDSEIHIVAIAHESRDAGYWIDRT